MQKKRLIACMNTERNSKVLNLFFLFPAKLPKTLKLQVYLNMIDLRDSFDDTEFRVNQIKKRQLSFFIAFRVKANPNNLSG